MILNCGFCFNQVEERDSYYHFLELHITEEIVMGQDSQEGFFGSRGYIGLA